MCSSCTSISNLRSSSDISKFKYRYLIWFRNQNAPKQPRWVGFCSSYSVLNPAHAWCSPSHLCWTQGRHQEAIISSPLVPSRFMQNWRCQIQEFLCLGSFLEMELILDNILKTSFFPSWLSDKWSSKSLCYLPHLHDFVFIWPFWASPNRFWRLYFTDSLT